MLESKKLVPPEEFWKYFQEISNIPRCSGKEEKIREYIKNKVENFGFEYDEDPAGNLIVDISLTEPDVNLLIIQSHMDMVCEKNEEVKHDFSKDPLNLRIIEIEGEDWVTAEGTSLGADNGVGVALSLALMDKIFRNEIKLSNNNLRFLFTVNEEAGLTGALHIDKKYLDGDYLINLDCMDSESIVVGSTDCRYSVINIKIKRNSLINIDQTYLPIKIMISGLLGGHSGIDIDKGRANAIKFVAEVLRDIDQKMDSWLMNIEGGESFNAIPREASSILYIKKERLEDLKDLINLIENRFINRFEGYENDIKINTEQLGRENLKYEVFRKDIQKKILNIIHLLPYGPIYWHPHIENLVHTSTNLGTIETKKNKIQIEMYHRSFSQQNILDISSKIKSLLDLAEIRYKMNEAGEFGVWQPELDTKFLKFAQGIFKNLFGKKPNLASVHAVLECGIFKNKCPELEIITMGPTIEACHSPDEKLKIKSVKRSWDFLVALLNEIK